MAWYRNYYQCPHCDDTWDDEWSCTCNNDCPSCHHEIEPYNSDDLTVVVDRESPSSLYFDVLVSPPWAEDKPMYEAVREMLPERLANHIANQIREELCVPA